MNHLQTAIEKSAELEQQLDNYTQHMAMMQQQAAALFSQFEQQRIQMQYDIVRMQFEIMTRGGNGPLRTFM